MTVTDTTKWQSAEKSLKKSSNRPKTAQTVKNWLQFQIKKVTKYENGLNLVVLLLLLSGKIDYMYNYYDDTDFH